MAIKSRGQIVNQTDLVQLQAKFYNTNGDLADLDSFPTIRIIQPSGNVAFGPTSAGVYRLSTGIYGFDYTLGVNASIGVWVDFWTGILDGQTYIKEFNFVVHNTQMPFVNSDGYVSLGDESPFCYSQNAIININKLLKAVKARLNSSGKAISYDQFGNQIYVDCDIFSTQSLVTFIDMALAEINVTPHFTMFTFNDTQIINLLFNLLVQGAVIFALASIALIEKGREFQLSDNGIQFTPASLSDLINTQYNTELTNWTEKVKYVKSMMKPGPISAGIMTLTGAGGGALPVMKAHMMRRQGRLF